MADERRSSGPLAVFLAFLHLGLTSFGGPVAHLGYFREEFVSRRRWLGERDYLDLVSLCQFLPGPMSTQVGMGIGLLRAGLAGGLAAWLGFSAPSALLLVAFGYGFSALDAAVGTEWLHGLKVVAVAIVALAVWRMARMACRNPTTLAIAAIVTAFMLLSPGPLPQIAAIVAGGLAGAWLLDVREAGETSAPHLRAHRGAGVAALVLFAVLLVALPFLALRTQNETIAVLDAFYRAGSLVFGGGHVVLPLLESAVVPPGWISKDAFLAGYGAAQAVPGPLFTFAAYLGALMDAEPGGLDGALLCVVTIFLPGFLLVYGVLPFWDALRRRTGIQAALLGVNAAVTGLLAAALYDPVWTSAVRTPADAVLALVALGMLVRLKLPPWLVVIVTAAGGALLNLLS